MRSVTRVIALEEAFLHPRLRELYPAQLVKQYDILKNTLGDVGPGRIARMDAAGIDYQVLSHVSPGVQTLDCDTAIRLSKEINDWLGTIIKEYPTRFGGFAMLPTQSPEAAAAELERTVTQLGFIGALINGHTHGRYLDEDSFSVLLERAQALDVPIYIHPIDPPQAVADIYYHDYPVLVTAWGWQVETGTHLLRMICGGVFDRYPRLKIIIGHMGESIPYNYERINTALTMGNWLLASQSMNAGVPAGKVMKQSFSYYMRQNVFITTSGVFDHAAFNCAVAELGIDNILFSVDDPFRDNIEAMEFLDTVQLSQIDKEKLAHGNAERVLRLTAQNRSYTSPSLSANFSAFKAKAKSKIGRKLLSILLK